MADPQEPTERRDPAVVPPVHFRPASAGLGSGRIVRNFRIWNAAPACPTRSWRKSSGPRLARRSPMATNGTATTNTTRPTRPTTRSISRFTRPYRGPVHLPHVEQQRHPLELEQRDLPQPLLDEQRVAPDPEPCAWSSAAWSTIESSASASRSSTTTRRPVLHRLRHERPSDGARPRTGRRRRGARPARSRRRAPRRGEVTPQRLRPPRCVATTSTRSRSASRCRPPAANAAQNRYHGTRSTADPKTTNRGSSASPLTSWSTDTTTAPLSSGEHRHTSARPAVLGRSGRPRP